MSKKIIFSMLGLLLLIVGGMSYKYFVDSEDVLSQIPASPQPKIISQINNTGNVNTGSIDTGSILSGEENNNINLDIVPLCENKLKPVKVIEMDKVVKNCTENKKEGRTLDGLGGVVPEYVVANNDVGIVLYDNNKKTDLLCKSIGEGGEEYYVRKLNNNTAENDEMEGYVNFPLVQLDPIRRVAKKGIFDRIANTMYPNNIFCGEGLYSEHAGSVLIDSDCQDMKESWATSDAGYYFVAGYRHDMEGKLLYVINDNIYYPGKSTIGNYDGLYDTKHIGQGIRQFITVKNNTIIVKRIKDEKININKKDKNGMNTTTYTLQTCEIPLPQ